jgi:hypothetical protein
MSEPEIRRKVVDAILESYELDAYVGAARQALIDSATASEKAMARATLEEEHLDAIVAWEHEPDLDAAAVSAAVPRSNLLAGLPGGEATAEMILLQHAWPWNDGEAARMAEVAPLWSAQERLVFKRRWGDAFPAGDHWPD